MSNEIILKDIPLSTPVKVEGGEALFTQAQLAEIYDLEIRTINDHIKHMEEDGELENSTIRSYRIVAKDGKLRDVQHYNVDVAYDLGFKVRNSARAKQFRAAVREVLKTLSRDGIVIDAQTLAKKDNAIEIAMQALKAIRADERGAMEKLNSFFKSSTMGFEDEIVPRKEVQGGFYGYVQNKLHFATHGKTAADLIIDRVDCKKANAGIMHFEGDQPKSADAVIAKNYLTDEELQVMNRLVNIVLDSALDYLSRGIRKPPSFWYDFIDKLMDTLGRPVLVGFGKYSRDQAEEVAKAELRKHKALESGQQEFSELTE